MNHFYSIRWETLGEPKFKDLGKFISMYRKLLSFNELCNSLFGTVLIPSVKVAFAFGFILCFFSSVRLYKQLDVTLYLLVVVFSITALVVLTAMSIVMSSLYDISSRFQQNTRGRLQNLNLEKISKKILKRELKGCRPLRCRVGSVYHMEAKAKLTLAHSVINGVACLLIHVKV